MRLVVGPPLPIKKKNPGGSSSLPAEPIRAGYHTGSPRASYSFTAPAMDGVVIESEFDRAVALNDSEAGGDPLAAFLAMGNLLLELNIDVEGRLDDQASLDLALQLVQAEGGIEEARALAFREGQAALDALECLPDGQAKESLGLMVDYVLCRLS